jgi:hypothetical protein
MDWKIIKRLEKQAGFFQDFLELEDSEQKWLFAGLSRSNQGVIKILKLIKNEALTYDEIADTIGCHPNTCKQKLLALYRGGFPLNMNDTCVIAETGRPRKLSRIE